MLVWGKVLKMWIKWVFVVMMLILEMCIFMIYIDGNINNLFKNLLKKYNVLLISVYLLIY